MADRKETSGEKRKQPRNDGVSIGIKRARDGDDDAAATDDEVEEFFAILRRIHVAVRYFKTNGEKLPAASDRPAGEASGGGKREVIVGLDLNVDPCPEEDPI